MFKMEIKTINDLESLLSKLKLEAPNKDENYQSKIGFSALTCVNSGITDNKIISGDVCEIYKIVGKLITKKYWDQYLKYTRYVCNLVMTEKFYEYAKILIDNIQLDKITNEIGISVCFDLFTRYYYNIFYNNKVQSEEISNYFQKLSQIISIARNLKCELFSELYNSVFSSESYVMLILANNIEHIQPFEKEYNLLMSEITITNNIDDVLIKLTKQVFYFIKYLDFGKSKSMFTLFYLKSLMNNDCLKCHKNWNYSIALYYYLLKLIHNPTQSDFNTSLKEVLDNFLVLFKREDIKQIWFMDLVVTFVQIFDRIKMRLGFLLKLTDEHFNILINIFKRLVKIIEGINYDKTFWSCCKSIRKHLIFKVCQILLTLCDNIIKLNFKNILIEKTMCSMLEYTIKIAECFECPKINIEIQNLVTAISNIIYSAKNKEVAAFGIILLKNAINLPNFSKYIDVLNQLKCYLHLYKIIEDSDMIKETIANYIVNLIHHKSNLSIIKRNVTLFYDMETTRTLIETVKSSKMPYKVNNFDKNLLINIEIEILNRNANGPTLKEALLKTCETHLEFALVLRQQNKSLPIIDEKYAELLKLIQKDYPVQELAENSLALGYISHLKTIHIFEKMRKTFNISTYSEEVLHSSLDTNKLRTIDKTVELKGVRCSIHSIKSFENFFQLSKVPLDIYVDWESILDDASMLGRVLHLRGYIDKAYRAWKLVYNISTVLDDMLNQCRALSFFCENVNFIKDFDNEIDIENEIDLKSEKILLCLEDIQYLTPRKQNYVLICILNISYFYSQINKYKISFNLLEMVNLKLNTLVERKNKFELVRATYHSIVFRLMTRINYDYMFPVSPYYYAYQITEQIKSVDYYTSEDSINFPLALYGIVMDIADYVSIRLCAAPIVPQIQMMLKFSIDNGCSYRIIQILSIWANINLQCEEVDKCEAKLSLIDVLMGNKNADFLQLQKDTIVIPAKPSILFEDFYDPLALEPIRKTAKYPPPIIKANASNHSYQFNLKDYLINHEDKCGCDICRNSFIKWQSFQIGCLRARSLFLKKDTDLLEDFFQNAFKWCKNRSQRKHDKNLLNNIVFWFFVYYVNELRRKKKFKKAIDICEQATNFYNSNSKIFDIGYRINFMDQKSCSIIKKKQVR